MSNQTNATSKLLIPMPEHIVLSKLDKIITLHWIIQCILVPLTGINRTVIYTVDSMIQHFNPFRPKGFPIDEQNRLALDRVKSVYVSANWHSRAGKG